MLAHHWYRRWLSSITYDDFTEPRYISSQEDSRCGDCWRIDAFSFVIFPSDSSVFPVLEICNFLHRQGHTIEFATLVKRGDLVRDYPFVSKVHVVGRAIPLAEEEELYILFRR